MLQTLCPFEVGLRLFDFSPLEPLLAAYIYAPSAKGQTPFHPAGMYLLSLFRRKRNLPRREVLRVLRHEEEGSWLRHHTGFQNAFPSDGLSSAASPLSHAPAWCLVHPFLAHQLASGLNPLGSPRSPTAQITPQTVSRFCPTQANWLQPSTSGRPMPPDHLISPFAHSTRCESPPDQVLDLCAQVRYTVFS